MAALAEAPRHHARAGQASVGHVVEGVVVGRLSTPDGRLRVVHRKSLLSAAKLLACAATLGSGGALGYEGPAILLGGSVGSFAKALLPASIAGLPGRSDIV